MPSSSQEQQVVIGLSVEARIAAADLDEAFTTLIRQIAPQVEVALGLMGLSGVSVKPTHARHERPSE